MPRPPKEIPEKDVHIKGLWTFYKEGKKTQDEIAKYYSKKLNIEIDQATISRKMQKMLNKN